MIRLVGEVILGALLAAWIGFFICLFLEDDH